MIDDTAASVSSLLSLLPRLLPSPPLLPHSKRASVALILRPTSGPPDLLFIQRSVRPTDPWSGHIAFPGGRRDTTDSSDLQTAIRETHEELGLDLSNPACYTLVGRLPDRVIHGKGNVDTRAALCAFVFVQSSAKEWRRLKVSEGEVAKVFWVSLKRLHGRATAEYVLHREKVSWWERWLGLGYVRMAAVDVMSYAMEVVEVGEKVGDVVLWGLSLACVGDMVHRLGGRRMDWPEGKPGNAILAWMVDVGTEVVWWVRGWGRKSTVGLLEG